MIDPDRVEIDADNGRARASFALGADADFLVDHFPGAPMLPGLLMLELAVRASAALLEARGGSAGAVDLLALDRFHVLRRVVPGEVLVIEAELDRASSPRDAERFTATATVDGRPALRAAFRVCRIPPPRLARLNVESRGGIR